MTSLQLEYSKQIAKQLGKIAVYLPGEEIQLGDIIKFPNGNKNIFGKAKPWGSFQKISSLKNKGFHFKKNKNSKNLDTYFFTTKDVVQTNLNANISTASLSESLPQIQGKSTITFSKEGGIYFLAKNCSKEQLDDLAALEHAINDKGQHLVWQDTFLVTSITTAEEAFIIQSNSKKSQVTIDSNIEGIQSSIANASFQILNQKHCSFIKPWSNNVMVFMDVVRFEEKVFSKTKELSEEINNSRNKSISFVKVNAKELLEDELTTKFDKR